MSKPVDVDALVKMACKKSDIKMNNRSHPLYAFSEATLTKVVEQILKIGRDNVEPQSKNK